MCKYVRDLKFHAIASPKTTRYNYPGGGWSYHPLALYTQSNTKQHKAVLFPVRHAPCLIFNP
jgi:hypothetical protein